MFLGRTTIDRRNRYIVLKRKNKEIQVPDVFGGDTMLWHQRLGHIREKGIQSLQDKGMVEGLANFNSDSNLYEHCLYGKKNQVKLPFGATREKEILELIHTNVFGFVPYQSLEGYLYYVIFIGDLSRNTWLYFFKIKHTF